MSIASHKLAVVIMVFNDKNQILLVRNKRRGWEFPGGYVDQGETLKEAAIREVKEETGIEISLTRFLGIEQNIISSTLITIFEGEKTSGEVIKSNETIDVGFFSIDSAQNMMTLNGYKERMIRCLNRKSNPFII